MANLLNLKSAYPMVNDRYGVEVDPTTFEDLAMEALDRINNRHTHLYRYTADTDEEGVLELPCNADMIESVHLDVLDAQMTSPTQSFVNFDGLVTEHYIEHWHSQNNPYYQSGKLVPYDEGDGVLYFKHPYKNVTVVYHGILVDDEDGLPLITEKERQAIACFVAYAATYRDALRKRDQLGFQLAADLENKWLRACNAARIPVHFSQNDMDAILDVRTRWDRKHYGKSFKPMI